MPETETVTVTMNDSQARNDHEGVPRGPSDQRITQDRLEIGHKMRLPQGEELSINESFQSTDRASLKNSEHHHTKHSFPSSFHSSLLFTSLPTLSFWQVRITTLSPTTRSHDQYTPPSSTTNNMCRVTSYGKLLPDTHSTPKGVYHSRSLAQTSSPRQRLWADYGIMITSSSIPYQKSPLALSQLTLDAPGYTCGHTRMVTDSSACPAPGSRNCIIVNMGVRSLNYPCNSCNQPRSSGGNGGKKRSSKR